MFSVISLQNLRKTSKLIFNYRLLTHNNFSTVLSHRTCKFNCKTMTRFLPCASISTSVKHWATDSKSNVDERYFYYDPVKDLTLVIHEDNPEMPEVNLTVVLPDLVTKINVKARVGNTVMKAILKHNEEGKKHIPMEAACHGSKACTTCHVYCETKDQKYFTHPDEDEDDCLDSAPFLNDDTSRLCCQMRILEQFDNVTLVLPKETTNFAYNKVNEAKMKQVKI